MPSIGTAVTRGAAGAARGARRAAGDGGIMGALLDAADDLISAATDLAAAIPAGGAAVLKPLAQAALELAGELAEGPAWKLLPREYRPSTAVKRFAQWTKGLF